MQFLLRSTVLLYSAWSVHGAIINVKQCVPPQSPHELKPVSFGDLPRHATLKINEPVPSRFSTTLNRTLILDRHFPDEWTIVYVAMQKLTDRIAMLTVRCPPFKFLTLCSHFMLVQSPSARTIWIKRVTVGDQYFYGFRHGWRKAFLLREASNASQVAFVLKVCNFWQLRLVIAQNETNYDHTRMRCAPIDINGHKREEECGAVNRIFAQLIRRVSIGRISYPDGIARLAVLKLMISVGCVCGYFMGVSALLKKFIK